MCIWDYACLFKLIIFSLPVEYLGFSLLMKYGISTSGGIYGIGILFDNLSIVHCLLSVGALCKSEYNTCPVVDHSVGVF